MFGMLIIHQGYFQSRFVISLNPSTPSGRNYGMSQCLWLHRQLDSHVFFVLFCVFFLSLFPVSRTALNRFDRTLANLIPSSYFMNESILVCLYLVPLLAMTGARRFRVSSGGHPMCFAQKTTRPSTFGTPQVKRSLDLSTTGFIYACITLSAGKLGGMVHRVLAL